MAQAFSQTDVSIPRRRPTTAVLMLALLPLCACAGNYLNENDTLRQRVYELETQNTQLNQRVQGLETQLQLEQKAQRLKLPEGVHQPRCVELHIDAYTSAIDKDRDGKLDHVRVYAVPLDADRRFVPTLGELSVSVVATAAGAEAKTVANKTYDIKAFHASYRAGLTGSHYTLDIPINVAAIPEDVEQLSLKLNLHDAVTGHRHEAGKIIPWRHP